MARKNRASVPNGIYHVTSRIVNREFWLADDAVKDEIVGWLYASARFSGVNLLAWCVMDNHFHIFVEVPEVPLRYRDDPECEPASYAFGMRPPECREPLWEAPSPSFENYGAISAPTPERIGFKSNEDPSGGDSRLESTRGTVLDGFRRIRPETGFSMSDEELLDRLTDLYRDEKVVKALRSQWARMREVGNDAAVDEIKDRYYRRMYNLSQFIKTFKERVAQLVKRERLQRGSGGHVGHVFESRFWSGLVERDQVVWELVQLYVDYNPYKARLVREGELYRWSSFGQACSGGIHAAECRASYERLYGRAWPEVRKQIEAVFAERLPENIRLSIERGERKATIAQVIKMGCAAISRGAFICRSLDSVRTMVSSLSRNFPKPSPRLLQKLLGMLEWKMTQAA